MKLISSLKSPYGRMARIVRLEKGLDKIVEYEVVQTRGKDNPYYDINPSGRVPSLIIDNKKVLEESALICWYLDNIDKNPKLHPPLDSRGIEHRRIEAMARSMLDGVSLWLREYIYRKPEIQSKTIIEHERDRASRMADVFEREVQGELLSGPINMAQITLACVLHGSMIDTLPEFSFREGRPHLTKWIEYIDLNPSVKKTAPN